MKGFKLYGLVVVTWLIVFSVSQAKAEESNNLLDTLIQEPTPTSVTLETAVYVHGKGWIMTPTPYPNDRRGG